MEFDTVEYCSERLNLEKNATHSQGLRFLEIWKELFKKDEVRPILYQDDYRAFALTLTAGQLNEYSGNGKLPNEYLEKHFASFSEYWIQLLDFIGQAECHKPNAIKQAAKRGWDESFFARTASIICHSRRFFRTRKGYFGLGPPIMKNGDLCSLFFGAEVPYILRLGEDGTFIFVGECYVHGIMYGEAMAILRNGELETTEFVLC